MAGLDFEYTHKQLLSFSEVKRIYEVCHSSFPIFSGFSNTDEQDALLEGHTSLPNLEKLSGIEIRNATIEGFLPLRQDPFGSFNDILHKAESTLGKIAFVSFTCGFEEINSEQNDEYYDRASVIIRNGKTYVGYWPHGSRVARDMNYRKEFFSKLSSEVNIPIMVEAKQNNFFLHHASNGTLESSIHGLFNENPSDFLCELFVESNEQLLILLRNFISRFGSQKRFEYSWRIGPSYSKDEPTNSGFASKIYNSVLTSSFPAERFSVELSFVMSTLDAVESLRNVLGSDGEACITLCSFKVAEKGDAELEVLTTSKGHQLKLALTRPNYKEEVETKLGLVFK